mgnify:CR=1 FL=1
MHRHYHFQVLLSYCISQQACKVKLRTHILCIPRIDLTCPHGEAVMMLCNRSGIFRSGISEKLSPFIRVESTSLRFEPGFKLYIITLQVICPGDEIVVRPVGRCTINLFMMRILPRSFHVHVAGIPFVCIGRYRVDSPVKIDSEFGILKPLGSRIDFLQRFEVRQIGLSLRITRSHPDCRGNCND